MTEGLLPGEGETKLIRKTRTRVPCTYCGEPATVQECFLLKGYRTNPASRGYGRDDCSWASDIKFYRCDGVGCRTAMLEELGEEYDRGSTQFKIGKRFAHLFLYWHEKEVEPVILL